MKYFSIPKNEKNLEIYSRRFDDRSIYINFQKFLNFQFKTLQLYLTYSKLILNKIFFRRYLIQ